MRENDLLDWLAQSAPHQPNVPIPIGDDMAGVTLPSNLNTSLALLKIDQALDGVHFDLAGCGPVVAGTKAVNRCLSDCAAMACKPVAIMISAALPSNISLADAKALHQGCRTAADRFDCPLVGGDTAIWPGRLTITVAALGFAPSQPILRSGAKPGDSIAVTGQLGGSILGRHLTFTPRINLALQLTADFKLHSMMDISDGLAADLPRLAAASGVGANVAVSRLPIHTDAAILASQDGRPAYLHALCDGEDYELLFTLDPHEAARLPKNIAGVPIHIIGEVNASLLLQLQAADGSLEPWPQGGYEHRSEAV